MKHLTPRPFLLSKGFFILMMIFTVLSFSGCNKIRDYLEPELKIETIATGFVNPIGVETDSWGRVWIAQGGTGKHDGKISVVNSYGEVHDVYVNLESFVHDNGEIEGPTHLLLSGSTLYIMGAYGKMLKANISTYKTGDAPKNASVLPYENIGAFVLDYDFKNKIYQTHPYGITEAPDGTIYITEAASNALLRRDKNGRLSVVAEIPGIPNPGPVGPPQIESVPTSVLFDGKDLLVTTLLGFPFPVGKSIIYKVTLAGKVSVYQSGFTSLVDMAEGARRGRLVLEHGKFGQMGFAANTGRLVWAKGNSMTELAGGLNLPAGLKQVNDHTWYVTSMGDKSLLKVTYK